MAKTKYTDDLPDMAKEFAEKGLSDIQFAKNLGIALSTYYEYQIKHPEAICVGKRPIDIQVENALLKRALGFEYVEEHSEELRDKKSGKVTLTKVKRIIKHIPADVRAIEFWLINRFSENWRNAQHIDHTTKGQALNQQLPYNITITHRKNNTE